MNRKPGISDDSSPAHRRVGDEALRRHLRRAYRSELTRVWLPAVCLLSLLIGGMSVLLLHSQEQSRVELERRFALRAALQSSFVAAYVADIHKREVAQAAELLAGRDTSTTRLARASGVFGSSAAVLLDAQGRALSVLPAKPELIGKRLDVKYAHLRAAVAGASAVSGVVPSAARSEPIVAFAVPFHSRFGRRVFSVGVPISGGPLRQFLGSGLPFKGGRAYLIDADGRLIVAGGSAEQVLALPPETLGTSGNVAVNGTQYRFDSEAVRGTPWRLLTLAPSSQLLAPLSGPKKWIPWVVLLAFVLAAAAALWLLGKLIRRNAELSHLAAHDSLTGAVNRPALELAFDRLALEGRRSNSATGVLAIDLDHFKDVNDLHGHAVGDE
ncbi:diguanylate cyclase, partial [Gaiella sp.]|uniref:sensor domain-containing diguanylate cyclase n=1 Tax=Gaiella sp. TaxID=2663207 RepID=UPI003982E04A